MTNNSTVDGTFYFTFTEAQVCAFRLENFLKKLQQNGNKMDEEINNNVNKTKFVGVEVPDLNTSLVTFVLSPNLQVEEMFNNAEKILLEGICEANASSSDKNARVEAMFSHISSMLLNLKWHCTRIFKQALQERTVHLSQNALPFFLYAGLSAAKNEINIGNKK